MAAPGRRPGALAAALVLVAVGVTVGAGLIGWAIGEATEPEASTVTLTVTAETGGREEPAGGQQASGRQAYLDAGCGACHGMNAEGTGIGPALAGHTAEQVRQQVRSPLAQMPAYSREQLSDADVEAIADYVSGLEPAEEHVEPLELSDLVATHHWMALSALAADDVQDALHHVGHIIERVRGEHLEAMERARALLRAGDLHEAEHVVEEMLGGKAKPDLGVANLHLRLALTAVDRRDRKDALHHVGHYLDLAKGPDREKGQAVLVHLRERDLHGAEHGLADLLGVERE